MGTRKVITISQLVVKRARLAVCGIWADGRLPKKIPALLALFLLLALPASSDASAGGGGGIGTQVTRTGTSAHSAAHQNESLHSNSAGVLVDLTLCIGCRACVVACKKWNGLPLNQEDYFKSLAQQQNAPIIVGDSTLTPRLSADTYTVVEYHEINDNDGDGESRWVFVKRQCMHCLEPACESACPVGALRKTSEGPVVYDSWKCMGCRYCMVACPFSIPTYEWQNAIPFVRKCTFCFDRITNDSSLPRTERVPACVKACPANALMFGRREQLLAEAHRRIERNPDKYVNHVYGEYEAGGTSWLYISPVPFDRLGFPTNVGTRPYPDYTAGALDSVPLIIVFGGTVLAGLCLIIRRRLGREDDACGFGRGGNKSSSGGAASPRGKTLLFSIVILAAIAAGAYSLSHKSPANADGAAKNVSALPFFEPTETAQKAYPDLPHPEEKAGTGECAGQQENGENDLPKAIAGEYESGTGLRSLEKPDIVAGAGLSDLAPNADPPANHTSTVKGDPP